MEQKDTSTHLKNTIKTTRRLVWGCMERIGKNAKLEVILSSNYFLSTNPLYKLYMRWVLRSHNGR